MSQHTQIFNESLAIRDILESGDQNTTLGLSKVLIIYTGGTIGMVNTNELGYLPADGYLQSYLKSQQRFCDPSLVESIASPLKEPSAVARAGATNTGIQKPTNVASHLLEDDLYTDTTPNFSPKDGFSEWLITPKMIHNKRIKYCIKSYSPLLDSCNIDMEDWVTIVSDIEKYYNDFDAFIVLHGTDTMAYTASALSFMLNNLGKTVIITGSQVPISEIRNDAVENLLGALIIAGHYIIPEVTLYFNNRLFRGNRCSKADSTNFSAFESPNLPPLVKSGVNIDINWPLVFRPNAIARFTTKKIMDPNVATLRLFPGITGAAIESFLSPPLRGIVLETYGSGNIPNVKGDILKKLAEASSRGMVIVNVTQCSVGNVSDLYETARGLKDAGVVAGGDMTSECALTKLSYLLGCGYNPEKCRDLMGKPLRGEMTLIRPNQPSIITDPNIRASSFVQYIAYDVIENKRSSGNFNFEDHEQNASNSSDLYKLRKKLSIKKSAETPDLETLGIDSPPEQVSSNSSTTGVGVKNSELSPNQPLVDVGSFKQQRQKNQVSLFERASIFRSFFPILMCSAASTNDIIGLRMLNIAAENRLEVTCYDYNGRTPLHAACRNGNYECARWLLKNGASVHVLDRSGHTPLFDSVLSRRTDLVELLLEAGAHFSSEENVELMILIYRSIHRCDLELIKLIVRAGIDLNKEDYEGRTPLHLAVVFSQLRVVDYLSGLNGVNLSARDMFGHTPTDLAALILKKLRSINFMAGSEDMEVAEQIFNRLKNAADDSSYF